MWWLVNRLPPSGWLSQGLPRVRRPVAVRQTTVPLRPDSKSASRPRLTSSELHRIRTITLIIGVDPHKSSHTATAVDPATNTAVASLRVEASLAGYRQLLRWAGQFGERSWAVEGARGLRRHVTPWLVARDEAIVDVPSTATARVRELSRGSRRKSDLIDAAAAASVAALHGDATPVPTEDQNYGVSSARGATCQPRSPACSNREPAPCGAT